MSDRVTPEALDRYLDALAGHGEAKLDSELADIAQRYLALGQADAPPGARERVLERVTREAGSRQNGHHAPPEPLGRQLVLARAGDLPGPEVLWHPSPVSPPHRPFVPRLAWPALLVLIVGLVAAISWARSQHREDQVLVAPAAEATQEVPPTPAISNGLALFTVDLPPGSLPTEAYGVTFDQRTMPPRAESTEASAGPLLVRYLVSGQVQVQADGVLEVCRAGCTGGWERVPANTSQTLTAGDAVVLRGAASLTWSNAGAAPVDMIAWLMTDQGGGNSEVPPGWSLGDSAAVHMALLTHSEEGAQLVLQRREVAPGDEIGAPPGSWLSHFVTLDHNAAGEQVAPMFGKLANGSRRNAGRQDLTIYQYILTSRATRASPAP